ncbi:MAG: hypothetical protein V4632_08855 [Pseudomonadota bacterium]
MRHRFTQLLTTCISRLTQAGLIAIALSTIASAAPPLLGNPPAQRAMSDRPDDVSGSQIHVIYAVPAGGIDKGLDTSIALTNSVGSMNNWLSGQTGGRWLQFDTAGGALDATFVQLPGTDVHYDASGARKRDAIEAQLKSSGMLRPEKIYAVFYEGGNPRACADAPNPPALPGQVTIWYLQGLSSGRWPCASNPFAASQTAKAGYRELSLLHELLHTLGAVSANAPHYDNTHVGSDPTDIMYAGSQPWVPSVLDVTKSNYYNPNGLPGNIFNLAKSTFLMTGTAAQSGNSYTGPQPWIELMFD